MTDLLLEIVEEMDNRRNQDAKKGER